jgi:hypothetical protein
MSRIKSIISKENPITLALIILLTGFFIPMSITTGINFGVMKNSLNETKAAVTAHIEKGIVNDLTTACRLQAIDDNLKNMTATLAEIKSAQGVNSQSTKASFKRLSENKQPKEYFR